MITKARPRAMKYSAIVMQALPLASTKPNASLMPGTKITNVVSAKEPIIAAHKTVFCFFILKMLCCMLRALYAWKISHILIVRNAIVIPWLDVSVIKDQSRTWLCSSMKPMK